MWPASSLTSCSSPRSSTRKAKLCTAHCPSWGSTAFSMSARASASSWSSRATSPRSGWPRCAAPQRPAQQPGHRGLHGQGRVVKVGVVTFPGSLDDADARRAVDDRGGRRRGSMARRPRAQGRRRRRFAGRLLVRRLPAVRGDCALRARDVRGHRRGQARHARPRHLQRLPDPVRVAPAAGGTHPQRPPDLRVPRPAAPHRERLDRVDQRLPVRRRGHHRAQERRGWVCR